MTVLDAPNPAAAPRRRSSRLIDRVSDFLGREVAFGTVLILDLAVLVLIVTVGVKDQPVMATTSVLLSMVTLVMVCAVQHTSSREAKALNLKLDELIRISAARNDLIGAEDESHSQLEARAAMLRQRHRRDGR